MGGRDAEGRAPQGIAEALVSTEPTIKQQASALLSAYAGAHSRYDAMEGNGGTAGRLAEAEARVLEVLERGLAQDDERSVELAALRERVRTLEAENERLRWIEVVGRAAIRPDLGVLRINLPWGGEGEPIFGWCVRKAVDAARALAAEPAP